MQSVPRSATFLSDILVYSGGTICLQKAIFILRRLKMATSASHTALSNNADYLPDPNPGHCANPSACESRHADLVAGANRTFETLNHWLFPTALQRTTTA